MNQGEFLDKCLESVYQQRTKKSFEVIVVDNDSDIDKGYFINKYAELIWVINSIKNPYSSRNMAIKMAKGKIIGFLDAKCVPQPGWLNNALEIYSKANDANRLILAGSYDVITPSSNLKDKIYGLLYLNNEKNVINKFGVTGGNLFVPKSAFEKLGGFQEDHVSGNDIMWTRLALASAFRIVYQHDVNVKYQGKTFKELKKSMNKYASGMAHHNQKQSVLVHAKVIFRNLMPMKFNTFQQGLSYRKMTNLKWYDKCYLWLLVWELKGKLSASYISNLINKASNR